MCIRDRMKHFVPIGPVYAYSMSAPGIGPEQIFVILNGSDTEATIDTTPWREAIGSRTDFTDVASGNAVAITPEMTLPPRAALILH